MDVTSHIMYLFPCCDGHLISYLDLKDVNIKWHCTS
jgi:hypothetical protein